jgi:hypothetical protein
MCRRLLSWTAAALSVKASARHRARRASPLTRRVMIFLERHTTEGSQKVQHGLARPFARTHETAQ